jgi:enoyl-CoA hydratase
MTSENDPATAEAPPEGRIITKTRGHIYLITIDRPAKRNGFSPAMLRQLAAAFGEFERSQDLRCSVMFANGSHFSAGLDLELVAPILAEGSHLFPVGEVDPVSLRSPVRTKPLVCAVQGICFTIGIELMLAADIVVAAEDCRFSQLEVKRGLMPTLGATFRLVERAGWGNAQRYLLTGEEFDAAEALRLGLVQEVVATGLVRERAIEIAERIAEQAPLAIQASLASSRRYAEFGPIAAFAEIGALQRHLCRSEDFREGICSFRERRPARFQGR